MKLTTDAAVHDITDEESTTITLDDKASISSDTDDVTTPRFNVVHDADESVTSETSTDKYDNQNTTSDYDCCNSEVTEKPEERCEIIKDYFQELLEGNGVCGDSRSEMGKPDWLDEEKFKRGQQFAGKYMFGVMHAEMLSLMILFSFGGGVKPLIFNENSHTPYKAFKRYLSTVTRVKSWQEEDIWDEKSNAHRNLKTVRCMHEAVRHRMTTTPPEELVKKVTLEDDKGTTPMWTDLHEEIREDFRSSCPSVCRPPVGDSKSIIFVNQRDMALTQFGFVGLILLFPKMFGIHDATDDDLDAFSHLWRTIGFCLGIEDRFNLCNGDLKTVQQRCKDIVKIYALPSLVNINKDWIHMSRCMVEGISYYIAGLTFEVALLYLCKTLSICAPKLYASLTLTQKFLYYYYVFLYSVLLRLPGMYALHNWLVNIAVKAGHDKSPKVLQRLETKMYPYEIRPGSVLCTRL